MTLIVRWTALAVVVTGIFACIYLVTQQAERQGADDAPGRLASQVAAQLSASAQPSGSADVVDIAVSDEAFFVVYDRADRPVSGTARLDGSRPAIPTGVLEQARRTGTDHVTWQTPNGRRFATVERRVGRTVVMAGQSLAPSETRTDQLGSIILLAYGCVLVVIALAFFLERASGEPRAATRR